MTQLVLGLGEIGSAIQKILNCDGYDKSKSCILTRSQYDVLHVCFPYFEKFEIEVLKYFETYDAQMIIIHSTVPIGTSESIGKICVASPCRGVHPHLEKGIRTFVKFFGGFLAINAAEIFRNEGIACVTSEDSRSIEAMKLWDTTIYGWNIILEKEIHNFCSENKLDFDLVYTWANETYNEGYSKLGMPQFQKYILRHKDGPIGGHCVIPNLEMLDSRIAHLIKIRNELLK